MFLFHSNRVLRFVVCSSLLTLILSEGARSQDRDRGERPRNRNSDSREAQGRGSTSGRQNSGERASDVFQATRLLGSPIRLVDGDRFGFVDDFVLDNSGRSLFVIAEADGDNFALPFNALSFGRLSAGPITLLVPISLVDGMPRFTRMSQLTDPAFQNRLITFFQDTAGLDGIALARVTPQEIQLATSVLGTNIRTADRQVVGSVGDLIIDQNGQIQFATTTVDGSLIPIPFGTLWLGDLAGGFVTVDVPGSLLVDAPPLTSLTTLDPSFVSQVNDFFTESQARASRTSERDRTSGTGDRARVRGRSEPSVDRRPADERARRDDRTRDDRQRQQETRGWRDDRNVDRRGSVIDLSSQRDGQSKPGARDVPERDSREDLGIRDTTRSFRDDLRARRGTEGQIDIEPREGNNQSANADNDQSVTTIDAQRGARQVQRRDAYVPRRATRGADNQNPNRPGNQNVPRRQGEQGPGGRSPTATVPGNPSGSATATQGPGATSSTRP